MQMKHWFAVSVHISHSFQTFLHIERLLEGRRLLQPLELVPGCVRMACRILRPRMQPGL
jgi:hypothetical protein